MKHIDIQLAVLEQRIVFASKVISSKIKAEGQYLLKRDAAKNAAFVQGVYCVEY